MTSQPPLPAEARLVHRSPEGGGGSAKSDREHDPRITVIQHELFNENRSKADKYRDLFIGRRGLGALLAYEVAMILASWVPGALGLVLRSKLYPLILGSVGRTHRLFTVEENPRLCGWGAEIVSIVADEAFYDLDGPPVRITTPHIPLPCADVLEDAALPSAERIVDRVKRSMNA